MKSQLSSMRVPGGRVVVKSPCQVGPEAFTQIGSGQQHCSHCQRVVHDLRGLSGTEIKALFVEHAGKVCGQIAPDAASQARLPLAPASVAAPWQTWAASALLLASSLTFWGSASAKGPARPQIQWVQPLAPQPASADNADPKANTLISGVLLDLDSLELDMDFEVQVIVGGKILKTVRGKSGLFHIDLQGTLTPNTMVTLVIPANSVHYNGDTEHVKHAAVRRTVALHRAQNLEMVVNYRRPRMLLGDIGFVELED